MTAIRPPTVPEGTARLRFTFAAHHSDDDIDRLVAAVRKTRRFCREQPVCVGGGDRGREDICDRYTDQRNTQGGKDVSGDKARNLWL